MRSNINDLNWAWPYLPKQKWALLRQRGALGFVCCWGGSWWMAFMFALPGLINLTHARTSPTTTGLLILLGVLGGLMFGYATWVQHERLWARTASTRLATEQDAI